MTSPDILLQNKNTANAPTATSWEVDDMFFGRAGLPQSTSEVPQQTTDETTEPSPKPWLSNMSPEIVDIFLGRNGISQ